MRLSTRYEPKRSGRPSPAISLRMSSVIPLLAPPEAMPRPRSRNRHRRPETHAANLWAGRCKSTRYRALLLEHSEDALPGVVSLGQPFLRLFVGGIPLQRLLEHVAGLGVQAALRVERSEVGVDLGVRRIVLESPEEILLGVLLPARIPALGHRQIMEVLG